MHLGVMLNIRSTGKNNRDVVKKWNFAENRKISEITIKHLKK
jgi:hypothetical protein